MNASQPAAAAANVGPGGAVATGFWPQRDATRHHPGGRQTSGRATAAETRVGRWVNAGAGPTRLHLWCARSRDRLSANHLSRICIRTRLGSPVLIGVGLQASWLLLVLTSASGARPKRSPVTRTTTLFGLLETRRPANDRRASHRSRYARSGRRPGSRQRRSESVPGSE